jgi:hypothetical protein
MSTAITQVSASTSITDTRKSVAQMVEQRRAIIEAMSAVMKKDIDYGVIPGTPKPTLYKPGSEKILSMFHLGVEPRVEDLSTPDCIRYRVHAAIIHTPTGHAMGTGIGEASSAESKYQWREVVCDQEWDATPVDRRREKWKRGKSAPYVVRQIRAEMEDVANTILKMAKKRAQIDGTLTTTAASDVFSQDLEDLKDAGIDPQVEETTPAQAEQTATTPSATPAGELPRKTAAPPAAAATSGAPKISEAQGKRFWGVALTRVGEANFRDIGKYLREVHGIQSKSDILTSRYDEAMKWAETGARP